MRGTLFGALFRDHPFSPSLDECIPAKEVIPARWQDLDLQLGLQVAG